MPTRVVVTGTAIAGNKRKSSYHRQFDCSSGRVARREARGRGVVVLGATVLDTERPAEETTWRIGEWLVEPSLQRMRLGDNEVRLAPKPLAVLLRLAAQPGQCVRRDVLIGEVWERQFVNDEVLSRTVAELRRLLGDSARIPQYIETIPKRGYRLVAPVVRDDTESWVPPAAPPRAAPLADATAMPPGSVGPASRRRGTWSRAGWLIVPLVAGALFVLFGSAIQPSPAPVDGMLALQQRLLFAQPVSAERALALTPRWSPDGSALLFARVPNRVDGRSEIVQRDMATFAETVLVDDGWFDLCPTLSPDGKLLAWLRNDSMTCRLMLRSLNGGTDEALGQCLRLPGVHSCPEFSSDGGALLFTGTARDGAASIVSLDLTSRTRRSLTEPPPFGGFDLLPRVSPDGRWLAFSRQGPDGPGRAKLRSLVDGSIIELQVGRRLNEGHAWLRDNQHLLLATDETDFRALVALPIDGSAAVVLGARDARRPDVSPGGALVWEAASHVSNLWLHARVAGGPGQRVTDSLAFDRQMDFDHDGGRIAYVSNKQGPDSVWVLDLDADTETRLPLPVDTEWGHPRWSADGQSLWLTRYEGPGRRVCVYLLLAERLDCPEALRMAKHGGRIGDGRVGFLRENTDRTFSIWLWDPVAGSAEPWIAGPVMAWRAAGDHVALQRPGESLVNVFHIEDQTQVPLVSADVGMLNGRWALSETAVIWVDRSQQVRRLMELAIAADSEPAVLRELGPEAGEVAVSPDGQRWVLSQIDELQIDLMAVPNNR